MIGYIETIIISLIAGGIVGFWIGIKFNRGEWTTDDCLNFLNDKGYSVKMWTPTKQR